MSDGKDHEGNNEPASYKRIDDSIAVAIDVTDDGQAPAITLTASHILTNHGEVYFPGQQRLLGPQALGIWISLWVRRPQGGEIDWHDDEGQGASLTQVTSQQTGTYEYAVRAEYYNASGMVRKTLESNWVAVTWTAPPQQ